MSSEVRHFLLFLKKALAIQFRSAGMIPYCATFTIFTDYMRGAIRIAALSQAGTIFVTTHDSIAAACLKEPFVGCS